MPTMGRKQKAAIEREEAKRRRKGKPSAYYRTDDGDRDWVSDSDSDTSTIDDITEALGGRKEEIAVVGSKEEESDGSELLEMEAGLDLDDWDPELTPLSGVLPIFTSQVSFEGVKGPKRCVYTGDSATTRWRRETRKAELAKEAAQCRDIRTYFKSNINRSEAFQESVEHQDLVQDEEGDKLMPKELLLISTPQESYFDSEAFISSLEAIEEGVAAREGSIGFPPEVVLRAENHQDEVVNATFDLLASCLEKLNLNVPDGLRVSDSQMRNEIVAHQTTREEAASPSIESFSGEDGATVATGVQDDGTQGLSQQQPMVSQPQKRKEAEFEITECSIRTILKRIQRQPKVDLRDIADLAVISDFNVLSHSLWQACHPAPAMAASLQIAQSKLSSTSIGGCPISKGAWYARQIRKKAKHIRETGSLPERSQGKGRAHASLLDAPDVQTAVKAFFESIPTGDVTPLKLMKHMNEKVLPKLPHSKKTIGESTAKQWMRKHGYRLVTHKNGKYYDGHERPDVVEYCKHFLAVLEKYDPYMRKYDGASCEPLPLQLPPGVKETEVAFHDECCFHANDQKKSAWLTDSEQLLQQKSRGWLEKLPQSERLESFDAQTIIYPGKNGDKYWDMTQLLEQIKRTIKICEVTHPDKQMLFIFDQSSAHKSFAPDALNAKRMNVIPGGKQPKMHSTTIPMNNPHVSLRGREQSMVFPSNHPAYPDEAKGMEAVLKERGLWSRLEAACAPGKSPVGRCAVCKASAEKRAGIEAEARARMAAEPDLYGLIGARDMWIFKRGLTTADLQIPPSRSDDALFPGKNLDGDDVDGEKESIYCCMEKCLLNQDDFRNEKPLLQLEIEAGGASLPFSAQVSLQAQSDRDVLGVCKTKIQAEL